MRRLGPTTLLFLALGCWLLGLTAAIAVLDRAALRELEPIHRQWNQRHAEHRETSAVFNATVHRLDLLDQVGQPPASQHAAEQLAWLARVEIRSANLRAELQAGLLEQGRILGQQGWELGRLRHQILDATEPILFYRHRFQEMTDLPPPSAWVDLYRRTDHPRPLTIRR